MSLSDRPFTRDAEIQRLARLLHQPPEHLAYLRQIDLASLQQLRSRATAMLYDSDSESLQKIAAATRLLPASLTALIAEKAFGPLLCARVAGVMPPSVAIDVAKRLPTMMLADVCLLLDPRRARAVVEGIPLKQAVDVSLELARRHEYVTMGQFVDVLPLETLSAVIQKLHDDLTLLKIAFFVEDRTRLNQVVELLPERRFAGIIDAALADDGAYWPEALALISELDLRWRRKFGEIALMRSQKLLVEMIHLSDARGLLTTLIGLGSAAENAVAIQNLQTALGSVDPAVFRRLIENTQDQRLLPPAPAPELPHPAS